MAAQNYQNHKRFSAPYHFITVPLMLIGLSKSIYHYFNEPTITNGLLAYAFGLICIVAAFARWFALRVQDRAARADERLRYYILTQKMLPTNLRMGQILALRFASDEEFPGLVDRAVEQKLSPKEIKVAIQNWRGDYHRI